MAWFLRLVSKQEKLLTFKWKVCYKCHPKSNLDENSQEYIDWIEAHGPKCTHTFDKSSKAMEAQGAVDMWNRSAEKNSIWYVDFVGDGECSSHCDVVKVKPYRDEVIVWKVECVGHIQNRMGGRLRRTKKDMKGKKLSGGKTIGGHNRLTENLIASFQHHYRKAAAK